MKIRRQTKLYRCVACGQTYLHDDAHNHAVFSCPLRPLTNGQRLQQFLKSGKVYEPRSGR